MNEKITFPRLASLLADRSGRSKRFSEDFLREFFALISERLEAGESVKVKGLGTFRLSRVEPRRSVDVTTGQPMEISGHSKVVFVPTKELAEAVNAPFEAFSAIEINDDADISQLFSEDEISLKEDTDDAAEETKGTDTDEQNPSTSTAEPDENTSDNTKMENSEEQTDSDDELQSELTADEGESVPTETKAETVFTESEAETIPTNTGEEQVPTETEAEATDEPQENEISGEEAEQKRSWLKILMISLGCAMVAIIATLAIWYVFANDKFNRVFEKPLSYIYARNTAKTNDAPAIDESPTVLPDTTKAAIVTATDSLSPLEEDSEVPTAPSDAVVYDTIGTTRYLTTMAKSHYGNYNLWPYIYEENKAFLGHPDRIRPGTPVVIPKLSKYGVDPTNEQDIEKAKKMGVEIYARYGKKI